MGGISQNLKATVTFGGSLASSWNSSTAGVSKSLKSVESQSSKLVKKQKDLAAKIKAAKLAGRDISDLKRDYAGVTREIKKTAHEQETLNRQLKRAQGLAKFKGLGKSAFGQLLSIGKLGLGAGVGGAGLLAGSAAGLVALNRKTAARSDTAGSYGVDIKTYDAWRDIAGQSGMAGADSVGDMFLKYKKSAGKYAAGNNSKVLDQSFKALGFGTGAMKGLTDIQQFNKIIQRAMSMKDQTKASFAVNSLLGPEAAKLLNTARSMGKSWKDIIADQQQYSLVTKDGATKAANGALAMDRLSTVFTSSVEEIAGQIGGDLAPKIELMAKNIAGWMRDGGIDKITGWIKSTFLPAAISFGEGLIQVGKVVFALAKKLAWLIPDEAENKKKILRGIASGDSVDLTRLRAQNDGLGEWFKAKVDHPGTIKQLRQQWSGEEDKAGFFNSRFSSEWEDGATKKLLESVDGTGQRSEGWPEKLQKLAQAGDTTINPQVTNHKNQTFNFTINADSAGGANDIADAVMDKSRRADSFSGNNALYDSGGVW